MLPRSKYLLTTAPDTSLWIQVYYNDQHLTREEVATISGASDVYHNWWRRVSPDNGRTWSEPVTITDILPGVPLEQTLPGGGIVMYPQIVAADSRSGRCYRFYMQRLFPGRKPFEFKTFKSSEVVDHVFVTEQDGPPRMLRYEEGAECDWAQPFDDGYCRSNRAYFGVNAEIEKDGTVLFPVTANVWRGDVLHDGVCLMRRDPSDGQWHSSNVTLINPAWSSRGLMEPSVVRLRNGAILIICRGDNTPSTSGRKWFVYSTDNGRTLSEVRELRYDDDTQFFSPSSIHRLIRSTRNGVLYWIANIVPTLPKGNSPRYPLVIARMDEERMAVVKSSLETVDDKSPQDPDIIQFSNFCVLEDRETKDMEIFMTRWGENPGHKWHADCYRYIYSPG